jgi:anti-sigma regulatory factor (Ser/Thr protein kinase)
VNFTLNLNMPSDPRFLSVVRSVVSELGSVSGLSGMECREVTLAVDEAMANIIRHAYRNSYDQAIQLNCEISAEFLEFRLIDQGEPPDQAKIRSEPLNDQSLSGRGTHMMKLIMDEVCYERVPEGNQLRLRKHLATANMSANGE